ncbi:hypothetical protein JOM56_000352 [Amanita muscaria]
MGQPHHVQLAWLLPRQRPRQLRDRCYHLHLPFPGEVKVAAVPSLSPLIHQNMVLQLRYHLKLGKQHPHLSPKLQNRFISPSRCYNVLINELLSQPIPLSRTQTAFLHLPERIPLPDSRPGTPTPVVNGGPPSRPLSPAPGANSTAGETPPPLPRRAAARGVSRLASNVASEPISRPSTPLVYAANTVSEVAESQEEAGEATQPPEVEKVPENNIDSPPSDPAPATESSSGHALEENGMEGSVNDKTGCSPRNRYPNPD